MHRILPVGTLPPTNFPRSTTVEWCDADTPEAHQRHGRSSAYGEHDIQYSFNAFGYRCAEFDARADISVLAVGCSYVFGIGVAQEDLFHERLAERLRRVSGRSVVVWNLAQPGASNDYISRLLCLAVPLLSPTFVLVHFTHGCRREYVTVQNTLMPYGPSFPPPDLVRREMWKHFEALSSPFDDLLNLFRNYKTIESLLAGRWWLFSTIEPVELTRLAPHLQMNRYVGHMRGLDVARDGTHPGPRSHETLMEAYWRRYEASNAVPVDADPPVGATARRAGAPRSRSPEAVVSQLPSPIRALPTLLARVGDLWRYPDFLRRRRARIRRARKDDSNRYPLW